jgi:hypothetical protein
MPTRSQVIASKIKQYDDQITGNQNAVIESAIAKLAIAQLADAVFSGSGDSTNSVQSIVSTETQINMNLAAGIARSFVVANDVRLMTFCTNGSDLVYYTTDGSNPTIDNAWFFAFGKETWDNNIPAGTTIKFLSPATNKLVLVVRY